ncbi:hypothetical protein PT274_03400 [Leuconostocaceae bacterium ESL0958]|nr:hypothetical protein [Leuconostocaceae bacterium ESL0958]
MAKTLREQVQEALDSDLTGYRLAQLSGMTPSKIYRLRNKTIALDNLSLASAEKIASVMAKSRQHHRKEP